MATNSVKEVLLEIEGSRKPMMLLEENAWAQIESEVKKLDPAAVIVQANDTECQQSERRLMLQRWSERWGFVDVQSLNEIKDGDRLTVSPLLVHASSGQNVSDTSSYINFRSLGSICVG